MRLTVWRSVQSVVKSHKNRSFSSSYLQKPRLRDTAASVILAKDDYQTDSQYSADLAEFQAAYPDIERALTEMRERYADTEAANQWFKKVLQYNMRGGSLSRGLAVVQSYHILAAPEDNIASNTKLAQVMGWCLELLHTSLVLTQDLIDQARERRGKPCWYLQNPRQAPDGAARLLDYSIYKLLKKHFRKKDYYIDALELFHTVGEKAMLGKILDMETRGDPTLSRFDMTTYNTVSKYRNAYHSFKLPVSLALYMAGIRDSEVHRQARTIQLEMGNFYQAQCDFFNCYGGGRWDHATPGHDIEDGRCTWLIVVALQRASPAQRQVLIENYGQKDEEKVMKVKEVYEEIGIPHTYKMFEEHSLELICTQIQQISRGLPHQLFFRFLKTMTGH
ncbi:farnesyl pyrophosphate synthase-like isoform X2 [Macrosteles quadrilineatus]|uniref:farnesyl pyrophosphate synthase-like isoform X2 n=1 Tax=Macrosteles quadrilineatus TaxID=74068 RepID=UPI0023E26F52|nr:farnesyl pyrophosphate synthase-like isoform X2 [Macrosteles quadrilineatus]